MARQPAASASAAVCVLTVGWTHVLLPADKGLKVAALLRGSVEVKHVYEKDGADWEIQDELEVTYLTTKRSSVRSKHSEPSRARLAIGHEPLKLPHV